MPTSTATHDVELEIVNDTNAPVTVRIARNAGSVRVPAGDDIRLVLATGTLYKYVLERDVDPRAGVRAVEMSVNIWRDARCKVSQVFAAPYSPYRCGCNWQIPLGDGIKVALQLVCDASPASRHSHHSRIATDPCEDTGWATGAGTR
ncbi:uncharacterized protein BXZ73DRAFT_96571 [Epithele typhae]|uniref:uncharacterized protein n=1 Tax=Epithele typhae TaxID=378194 RepID=UPI002008B96B|nr:uncharacterized protein BXZ73DRAFT_96571 [Epithele typhae]KAH9944066.1 hypothetical protein BXZ73DRAFT_96571 [Epithele typhae]